MKIDAYRFSNGDPCYERYLKGKSEEFRISFFRILIGLQNETRPMQVDHIRGSIYEIKIRPNGEVCRPLYAYINPIKKTDIVILHVVDHLDGKKEREIAVKTAIERLERYREVSSKD